MWPPQGLKAKASTPEGGVTLQDRLGMVGAPHPSRSEGLACSVGGPGSSSYHPGAWVRFQNCLSQFIASTESHSEGREVLGGAENSLSLSGILKPRSLSYYPGLPGTSLQRTPSLLPTPLQLSAVASVFIRSVSAASTCPGHTGPSPPEVTCLPRGPQAPKCT